MLPLLYNGYRFIFGNNRSGAKWGIWCLAFGFLTYFVCNAVNNYVITPELARRYLFLFIISMFIAITVYNSFSTMGMEEEGEDSDKGESNNRGNDEA
ncbi:hypothetical protein UABAM_03796 [Candidatus Uabimicrobium amorphum]|uniref:Uncharacterized protein n=2 Tax=Uabimicrobium amorphum TaxID=2596890 RepID=A0A5S9IP21_UABAM|nr:hypothetical protein UABAM_03796 [Candidatus Uabimicrobium amorphum]